MIVQGPWNIPIWESKVPELRLRRLARAGARQGPHGNARVGVSSFPTRRNMMWHERQGAKNPAYVGDFFRWFGTMDGQVAYANIASCADPAIFPEASRRPTCRSGPMAMLDMAEKYVRIAPEPVRRAIPNLSKVPRPINDADAEPCAGGAGAVRRPADGCEGDPDRRSRTPATRHWTRRSPRPRREGAKVSREDFVFPRLGSAKDYGPADYAELCRPLRPGAAAFAGGRALPRCDDRAGVPLVHRKAHDAIMAAYAEIPDRIGRRQERPSGSGSGTPA